MTDILLQDTPVLEGPTEKEKKYDRQLRLWAATGQAALEGSNVLLINASCGTVGVEILKNLVLPGIGRFTIADEGVVTEADLGVNFFLDAACLGKSRAESCRNLLVELNQDVIGDWFPKAEGRMDVEMLLSSSQQFTTIIYTLPLQAETVQILEMYASKQQVPLLAVHCTGFYSYFTTKLPCTHPVVDTHPDEEAMADLRLLRPWQELAGFSEELTRDIDTMDDHAHGHLPMVVLLIYYLEKWKLSHNGDLPLSYKEKVLFRDLITSDMRKNNPEGGEENFEEAISAVMKHVASPSLSPTLKGIFESPQKYEDQSDGKFWLIAEAVKQFYNEHQELPLPGSLPDMKAESEVYIRLQNIYKAKARNDLKEVMTTLGTLEGGDSANISDVELFCKNARFIKLVSASSTTPIGMKQLVEKELASDANAAVAGPELPLSLLPIYLVLRSIAQGNHLSCGDIVAAIEAEFPGLKENQRLQNISKEIFRADGGELHNIAAVTGGMVAQEMIKIITKQYVPIDNLCIFDGIESRCQVLRVDLGDGR